jgi:hypothetical protein
MHSYVPLTGLHVALPIVLCRSIKFLTKELAYNRIAPRLLTDTATFHSMLIIRMSLFDEGHVQYRLPQIEVDRSVEPSLGQLRGNKDTQNRKRGENAPGYRP